SYEDEASKPRAASNKKKEYNNFACASLEQLELNNTIPTNNLIWPYRQNQDLANNCISKSLTNYQRPLRNIDPTLIYNSDHVATHSSNITYNTVSSNESANRFRASTLFYEHGSAASRNLITPEPHRSLSTMSLDNISDSQSLTGYDLLMNNQNQETFTTQQNYCKEKISRPNAPSQHTSSLSATSCNMSNMPSQYTSSLPATSCNMPNQLLVICQMSQYSSFSPTTSHDISTWNSNNNSQKYYHQHREKISSVDIQFQHASYSQANSYNKTANTDSEELNFSDEESLVNWLCTRPDLINKVQILSKTSLLHKIWQLLLRTCLLKTENIEQFVAGKVWRQKLSKYLDASDFSEFKKSSSSLKSLESFVAESLKIHIEYLIEDRNQKKPSYIENVLAKIKTLDQLTFHLTIPSSSRRNYANELDIDQASTELSSDNE
ncbi:21886_t:CDS:2, partial [Gigaspora rosea]